MLDVNGNRMLAHIQKIEEIKPIENYDRVEYAKILGWWVIVRKNEFKVGDLCVYFEIDSLLPETEWSEFLRGKHFKIKTQKMCKVISQGLALPLSILPKDTKIQINEDMTKILGVKYITESDNKRKSNVNKDKYAAMAQRNPHIFKKKFVKKIMCYKIGRKLMFLIFGNKKRDKPLGFPTHFEFIKKTDEERIENMPWILEEEDTEYIETEKLDGTSATYILERIKPKYIWQKERFEFYVLSRNVRQMTPNQSCYHDDNVYWNMVYKYDIDEVLQSYLYKYNLDYVAMQGEIVGSVQGNPLKLKEDDFYCFNLIRSDIGRVDSIDGMKEMYNKYNIKWVPILNTNKKLPRTMQEIKKESTGFSVINPDVYREGLVYRSRNNQFISFKNVSPEFLLKRKD